MARPLKKGFSYFSFDTGFFSNFKIKILKARYGSDGLIIFIYLLCEIYGGDEEYRIRINDDFEYIISDELGIEINKVKQVINFLLKRSLFDNKPFNSDKVLTSAGIQKRFQLMVKERARKSGRFIDVGADWLLNRADTEPFIKCTLFEDIPSNNNSFSENNSNNSKEQSIKESKVNNVYIFTPQVEKKFQKYLSIREVVWGFIDAEQIEILREKLQTLSDKENEQIAILNNAIFGKWKNLYPLGEKPNRKQSSEKPKQQQKPVKPENNKFNNFTGRSYDMNDLERNLLLAQQKQMEEGETGGGE